MLREARLLRALEQTEVRVPRVLATCEDESVIGAPFYVMELIEGETISDTLPPALGAPAQRGQIADELIDALAEVHAVEWSSLVFDTPSGAPGGFGRPTGYLERQLRRFSGLWEHNRLREIAAVTEVGRWLAEHMPESPPATIVHGDYRLGNVLFAAAAPARLEVVLDWEMATIGDPLADVGYMVSHWREDGDPPSRFSLQPVTERPGFPSRRELVQRYATRSGRSVQNLDWYVVLALWKSVVFMEGNYARALAGASDDPYLKTFGDGVVELAGRALAVTRQGL